MEWFKESDHIWTAGFGSVIITVSEESDAQKVVHYFKTLYPQARGSIKPRINMGDIRDYSNQLRNKRAIGPLARVTKDNMLEYDMYTNRAIELMFTSDADEAEFIVKEHCKKEIK